MKVFADRKEAGIRLAEQMLDYKDDPNTILIALPRGGVVVGVEAAHYLHLPLDIVAPRKVGAPFNPELAIGAVTETGEGIFSTDLIRDLGITDEYLQKEINKERKVAEMRLDLYRKGWSKRTLKGKRVILIDDGLATGSTMQAAIKTVKSEEAKEIIIAIPVAPKETIQKIKMSVDKIICLSTPSPFYAVGEFYEDFREVKDDEVIRMLSDFASKVAVKP